jgi:hypothetical protein
MAKYFIIGEAGENELWLVDIDSGIATAMNETDLGNLTGTDILQVIETARKSGVTAIKGINIAIASGTRAGAKARSYSESNQK